MSKDHPRHPEADLLKVQESFDFDQWANQVRPQLLACLNRMETSPKSRRRKALTSSPTPANTI
uniref:Uncharacterized protein n=1 Tax=Cyanothece sp. (strain PCC 7425 / ATCC 29141) TaxID=395961 RepID=B8HKQ3_CYAP4